MSDSPLGASPRFAVETGRFRVSAEFTYSDRPNMLPDIKISLPIIFAAWCIAAVTLNGPVMLAYPAMWLVVGVAFWALDRAFRGSRAAESVAAPAKEKLE